MTEPTAMSRRRYAKARGVDESTIRKAINSGRLRPAVRDDDKLDVALADRLLAQTSTSANSPFLAGDLAAALRLKTAAECALLQDEIAALRKQFVSPQEVRTLRDAMEAHSRNLFHRYLAAVAPEIARQPAAVAGGKIYDAAHAALQALADTHVVSVGNPDGDAESAETQPLGQLSHTELRALKARLQTARIEFKRAVTRGDAVDLAEVERDVVGRIMVVRARMLGLASKTAPLMAIVDEAEAARILAAEIDDACDHLKVSA